MPKVYNEHITSQTNKIRKDFNAFSSRIKRDRKLHTAYKWSFPLKVQMRQYFKLKHFNIFFVQHFGCRTIQTDKVLVSFKVQHYIKLYKIQIFSVNGTQAIKRKTKLVRQIGDNQCFFIIRSSGYLMFLFQTKIQKFKTLLLTHFLTSYLFCTFTE